QVNEQTPYVAYVVTNSGNWVYAGSGFRDGDSVPGIVGYEADQFYGTYPMPNSVNGTFTLLSHSPLTTSTGGSTYANSSVYQAPSGAWVFAAGTIGWAWALDNYTGYNVVVDRRIQQMTANILDRFINLPVDFSIAASPSIRTVTPGAATSYTLAIGLTGGFTGQVTLSVSGLPSGASATFTPNPASASSTLSVTTS